MISLILFGMLHAGLGTSLITRLHFFLAPPGAALPNVRISAQLDIFGAQLAMIALVLIALALRLGLWGLWRTRKGRHAL